MKQTLVFPILLLLLACTSAEAPTDDTAVTDTTQPDVAAPTTTPPAPDSIPFTTDYLTGHFEPAQHPDFSIIDAQYADREGLYLRKDAYAQFKAMYAAAQQEGVKLIIRSATRNFNYQKGIWERKWNGERALEGNETAPQAYPEPQERALAILRYSSMPGTSRHHWGTDIDLNSFDNDYFATGEGKKIYDWLLAHAAEYGFCQPYTAKGPARPEGYNEERWHWSYLPVASQLTRLARRDLQDSMIAGFAGAEVAPAIGVVQKYVLGVSEACQEGTK